MFDDILDNVVWPGLLITVPLISVLLLIWACVSDAAQWKKYSSLHHCAAIGTKDGQLSTGLSADGKLVTTLGSDQTIYKCDGGEIRIR